MTEKNERVMLQYYNGSKWVDASGPFGNEQMAWVSLGEDNRGYRTIGRDTGTVFTDKNKMAVKCYICGATNHSLKRANPKGEAPALWECLDCLENVKGDMALFEGMDSKTSADFQLMEWVKGNPQHNPIRNECCPDFSCCQPQMLMNKETRLKFREAHFNGDEGSTMALLGTALSGLATEVGKDIYITGEENKRRDIHVFPFDLTQKTQ